VNGPPFKVAGAGNAPVLPAGAVASALPLAGEAPERAVLGCAAGADGAGSAAGGATTTGRAEGSAPVTAAQAELPGAGLRPASSLF
jgi:hypothetical protein